MNKDFFKYTVYAPVVFLLIYLLGFFSGQVRKIISNHVSVFIDVLEEEVELRKLAQEKQKESRK